MEIKLTNDLVEMRNRQVKFNLEGKLFGKWTVGEYIKKPRGEDSYYICTCQCGTKTHVRSRDLRNGASTNCGCSNKLPTGQAALNCVLSTYKNTARKRGIVWNLSNDEFFGLTKKNCYYCDRPPYQIRSYKSVKSVTYMGIDRIDSSLDYTSKNVLPCCKMCNYAKSSWTQDEFYEWIGMVFNHRVRGVREHAPIVFGS